MTTFVNPVESVETYRNRQLAPLTNKQSGQVGAAVPQGPGIGVTAYDRMGRGQVQPGAQASIDRARSAATRQHNMLMAKYQQEAAQRRAEEERQRRAAMSGGGGTWRGGAGGPLVGSYGLIAGADAAFRQMSSAFQQQFGYHIPVTEGGRSYERQQQLYNLYLQGRGNLAARPGTSLHESGRAVDLGGPFTNANSREHIWLQQNAHRWGYKWTGKNFSQFEPWHWEWHG